MIDKHKRKLEEIKRLINYAVYYGRKAKRTHFKRLKELNIFEVIKKNDRLD